MSTGEVFSCPVGGWLDNKPVPAGPASRTVSCASSGDCTKKNERLRNGSIKHRKLGKLS